MATQHDTCQNRWLRSILTIRFKLTLSSDGNRLSSDATEKS